jgi:hypothetical protein
MKRVIALFTSVLILNASIAVVPSADVVKPVKATEIMLPIGKTGQKISLAAFSKLKPSEYEKLAHVKLGFFDRIAYKKAMRKLRRSIAADGTITNKKIAESVTTLEDGTEGFHLGGAALGFLLGLLGILIAYLINDDNHSNRVKWAWIGFAAWVAIILIVVVL